MYIQPVILCGGSGLRLWPLSRLEMPKQFLKIFNNKSLLEMTLERIKDLPYCRAPIIITSYLFEFYTRNLIEKLNLDCQIILEPEGKNTTAAIYIASKFSLNKEDLLLILPSDHLIPDKKKFSKIIDFAFNNNVYDHWLLFGVKPTHASISYGYIEIKNNFEILKEVVSFREKPNLENATKMFKSKNFFWNSGIFMGRSETIMNSIESKASNIARACNKVLKNSILKKLNKTIKLDKKFYKEIKSVSIDYSVLEKERKKKCIIFDTKWSDVGSWDSLIDLKDYHFKNKNVFQMNGQNNVISFNSRVIATLGVEDLIIIDSNDATFVTKKNKSEDLKPFLELIGHSNPDFIRVNTFEERPWGRFEVLLKSKDLKVKKLNIYPNKRLSLQYHKQRSEHWFIIEGTATIHLEGKEFILDKGNSIDIPVGKKHFIGNHTLSELVLIEIQQGNYLEEDDIIRLDDPYGR